MKAQKHNEAIKNMLLEAGITLQPTSSYSQYTGPSVATTYGTPVQTKSNAVGTVAAGLLASTTQFLQDPQGCAIWDAKCKENTQTQLSIAQQQAEIQRLQAISDAEASKTTQKVIIIGAIVAALVIGVIVYVKFLKK